jgi:predicted lactoylglutathione lyase
MPNQIFINLPIKDLTKSVEFFTKLGFTFNPQFTDQNATCMIVSENIFVMLLVEPFFQTFTKKQIADTSKAIETLLALSFESKEEVNEMADKAIAAGATEYRTDDQGFMFTRAISDLDGHCWELFWMDPSYIPHN